MKAAFFSDLAKKNEEETISGFTGNQTWELQVC
jgi:hypothetical protein